MQAEFWVEVFEQRRLGSTFSLCNNITQSAASASAVPPRPLASLMGVGRYDHPPSPDIRGPGGTSTEKRGIDRRDSTTRRWVVMLRIFYAAAVATLGTATAANAEIRVIRC
jgi:hypothetical protein